MAGLKTVKKRFQNYRAIKKILDAGWAHLEDLIYFAKERESIRKLKESGAPAPWTQDLILQIFRFCNLRRRDDRVSRWLREHVLTQKNIDYDLRAFLQFSAWARLNNWPPTVEAVMAAGFYPRHRINWKGLGKFLDQRSKKQKTWTGAFMLPAPKTRGKKKGKFISELVVGKNFAGVLPELQKVFAKPPASRSCQEVWIILRKCKFLGSFLSGQIVADWSYTSLLNEASDLYTWAAQGPGSKRGFNRVMGRSIKTKISQEEWDQNLPLWRREIITALGPEYEDIDLQSIQNLQCEFDKWCRVKNNEGRPRAKYRAHEY